MREHEVAHHRRQQLGEQPERLVRGLVAFAGVKDLGRGGRRRAGMRTMTEGRVEARA